jgi:bisanhydrobacterioruberin hydratase
MGGKRNFTKELLWIYGVGITGMLIPYTRPLFMAITPVNLLVVAGLLFYSHSKWDARTIIMLAVIGVVSFFVEAVGVNTGLIFGEYSYGRTLGPVMLNTPLMIGVNWIILVYICHSIAVMIFVRLPGKSAVAQLYAKAPALMTAFVGALLMVTYDFVLEPSAIALDMWTWAGEGIPLQNYVSWYLFSFLFILLLGISRVNTRNVLALPVYLVQVAFFIILDLWFLFFY